MDQFWRLLRIGCISGFAIIGVGVTSCTAEHWITEYPKARMREALMARGFEVLQRKHSNAATTVVSDLFGADLDGVCVVTNSPPNVTELQATSPGKLQRVISDIAEMNDPPTTDGDHWYEYIYAVKGGAIIKKYEVMRGSYLVIDVAGNGCYDADAPTKVQFYPDDQSLVIGFPANT